MNPPLDRILLLIPFLVVNFVLLLLLVLCFLPLRYGGYPANAPLLYGGYPPDELVILSFRVTGAVLPMHFSVTGAVLLMRHFFLLFLLLYEGYPPDEHFLVVTC